MACLLSGAVECGYQSDEHVDCQPPEQHESDPEQPVQLLRVGVEALHERFHLCFQYGDTLSQDNELLDVYVDFDGHWHLGNNCRLALPFLSGPTACLEAKLEEL